MLRKLLLALAGVMMVVGVVYARDVNVSDISISNVDVGAGTCTINYTLSRTQPVISADQPVWVFVKYRLTTDSDYTGWRDTDDNDATNDNSDGRFEGNNGSKNQCDGDYPCTVNKYLSGDDVVGMVTSGGPKQITWTWGASGTGLSSANSAQVRAYPIEMVKVPKHGAMTFGTDGSALDRITSGSYTPSSDYYLMKYPCTVELYAAFLNCCVNRHDSHPSVGDSYKFYNIEMTDGDRHPRLNMAGTIGTNAVFTAKSGQEHYPMANVNWYEAYDWCKWAGLRLPTEEEFEYEASNVGTRDFPWGDNVPTTDGGGNVRCNMDGASASDVRTYDEGVQSPRKSGLSAHNAADMSGNMLEWQFTRYYTDSYNSTYSTDSDSCAGYGSSSSRVVRSGDWPHYDDLVAARVRAGSRRSGSPSGRCYGVGFRAAR